MTAGNDDLRAWAADWAATLRGEAATLRSLATQSDRKPELLLFARTLERAAARIARAIGGVRRARSQGRFRNAFQPFSAPIRRVK